MKRSVQAMGTRSVTFTCPQGKGDGKERRKFGKRKVQSSPGYLLTPGGGGNEDGWVSGQSISSSNSTMDGERWHEHLKPCFL